MDFRYSKIVDPLTYCTDGLCVGIPLRLHEDELSEINGAIRCQKDWSERVGLVANYKGTLGTPFSFVRVTIPESLPDRLEIISYANEYAFIYDDVIMENLDQVLDTRDRSKILKEFAQDVSQGKSQGATYILRGAKQIQAQIFAEMIATDKERAITTMRSWQRFIDVVSSRQRSEPFNGLEDYLPYRISDAGELFWFGLVTFAMGLTIPEEEMDLCKELGRPSWEALALTNDFYSWEKERNDRARLGQLEVMNAIWILMRQHAVTEAQAKELCRQKIKESVANAVQAVDKTRNDTSLSLDLRKYIEAIMYSISGNLVWSIYCPRYHPEETFGEVELMKMAEVTSILHSPKPRLGVL